MIKNLIQEKEKINKIIFSKKSTLENIMELRELYELNKKLSMFSKTEIEKAEKELNINNNNKENKKKKKIKLKEIKEYTTKKDFDAFSALMILLMFNNDKNISFFKIVLSLLMSETTKPKNNI